MGLFSGSTTTKTNEKFDTGPSSFQRPYLDETFGAAKDIYGASKGTPYYQGETWAGMSPEARASLDRLKTYASGTGLDSANQLYGIGSSAAGYADRAGSTIDRLSTTAGEDATASNIAAAGRYADNPFLQGQIDANARDVTRNLSEDILPSIDRSASATGNLNSSRAGVAAGIARRGAEDRIADISATMRGDAYNRGLSMAQADRASTMGALGDIASSYGNLASFGVDALGKASDTAYSAFDQMSRANSQEQADRQGYDDAAFKRWQGEDTRLWDILDRYYGVVGGSQWGQSGTSSGTSKTKATQSLMSMLAGASATAASIYTGQKK